VDDEVREWSWWRWPVLAGCLVILGLDIVSFELSGHADWRQHLRFSHIAHALTGLEIFVGLPLLHIPPRRYQAGQRTQLPQMPKPSWNQTAVRLMMIFNRLAGRAALSAPSVECAPSSVN
jgi:hypothetical protein